MFLSHPSFRCPSTSHIHLPHSSGSFSSKLIPFPLTCTRPFISPSPALCTFPSLTLLSSHSFFSLIAFPSLLSSLYLSLHPPSSSSSSSSLLSPYSSHLPFLPSSPVRFEALPAIPSPSKHGCEAFLVSYVSGILKDIPGLEEIRAFPSFR